MRKYPFLTFEEVRIVLPIRTQEKQLFRFGFGRQNRDGAAHTMNCDRVSGGYFSRKGYFRVEHGSQPRADFFKP